MSLWEGVESFAKINYTELIKYLNKRTDTIFFKEILDIIRATGIKKK